MSDDICDKIEELGLYAGAEGTEIAEYCYKLINLWEVKGYSPFEDEGFAVAVEKEIEYMLTWFKSFYEIIEETETVKTTSLSLVEK